MRFLVQQSTRLKVVEFAGGQQSHSDGMIVRGAIDRRAIFVLEANAIRLPGWRVSKFGG
jgi:hypothetical protein